MGFQFLRDIDRELCEHQIDMYTDVYYIKLLYLKSFLNSMPFEFRFPEFRVTNGHLGYLRLLNKWLT